MKTTILVSVLCLSAMGSYAQSQDNSDNTAEKQAIKERAISIYEQTNGNMGPGTRMHYKSTYSNIHAAYPDAPANAVPATPSAPYVALQDPPCYKYKTKRGLEVMECPGARFLPDGKTNSIGDNATEEQTAGNISVNRERTYLGYYGSVHALYPEAPKNAVPAWPSASTDYEALQDPPCYKYINKRGLEVMECPGARFAPEHDRR